MELNFENIHIGEWIKMKVEEEKMTSERICNFFKCTESDVIDIFKKSSIDAGILLRWSKLLKYDFFRIYSQHLILYAPVANVNYNKKNKENSKLPQFRKNIYTKEVIDFVLELIETGKKSKIEVIEEYNIPKTTLYKWITKHKK
ncbi:transposase [Chryseobacterium sp.]|uniref:transposase n=1 Tax=Chryseobacterium sp. TaxID=1871047 RepID=UPI0031DC50C7